MQRSSIITINIYLPSHLHGMQIRQKLLCCGIKSRTKVTANILVHKLDTLISKVHFQGKIQLSLRSIPELPQIL